MKKFLIILLAFLTVASTSEARKVKGKVTGEGKALSGVIVTDGKNFTQTNSCLLYTSPSPRDRG